MKTGAFNLFVARIYVFLGGVWLLFAAVPTHAANWPGQTETPISFFTNVAAHLLRSQLDLDLQHIQLYPTNQYTRAVHRLLQVAANVYDSTTNRALSGYPYVPSVFRPLFTNDGGAIYIVGYVEETGTNFLGAVTRDLTDPDDRTALQTEDMVYGVPVLIGVKKGFPNFNELEMQTAVQVIRRLQFRGSIPRAGLPFQTNQMYIVGISNVLGVEAWNPYSNAFPRDLELTVTTDVSAKLTNEEGAVMLNKHFSFPSTLHIQSNTWSGFINPNHAAGSLLIPLQTNFVFLNNSTYAEGIQNFVPLSSHFEQGQGFYVPQWWLKLSVRLRFALTDTSITPNRVVDFADLRTSYDAISITTALTADGGCSDVYIPPSIAPAGALWCTNRATPDGPSYGLINQIRVGLGSTVQGGLSADLNDFVPEFPPRFDKDGAIDFFRTNLLRWPAVRMNASLYLTNVFYAPFSPTRTLYITTSWQANDPLVHHMVRDLVDNNPFVAGRFDKLFSDSRLFNLGRINDRYEPWGGNPSGRYSTATKFVLQVKDPLVSRADDWNFPTGSLAISSLGQIHRGTPWQTLYLKSPSIDPVMWWRWVGSNDFEAAQLMQPTNDWRLVSALISLLAPENVAELVSVNEAKGVRFKRVLNGLAVLTNISSGDHLLGVPPQFESLVIHPNVPQVQTIISAIEENRASQPSQIWLDRGDILSTPALSILSPWLNLTGPNILWGISDDALEKIPSQILQRLRSDAIGSVMRSDSNVTVRFRVADGYAYALEWSSDLLNWTRHSTNYPCGGIIEFSEPACAPGQPRFYRSVLLHD